MISYSRRYNIRVLADKIQLKSHAMVGSVGEDYKYELRRLMTLSRKLREAVTDLYDKEKELEKENKG